MLQKLIEIYAAKGRVVAKPELNSAHEQVIWEKRSNGWWTTDIQNVEDQELFLYTATQYRKIPAEQYFYYLESR